MGIFGRRVEHQNPRSKTSIAIQHQEIMRSSTTPTTSRLWVFLEAGQPANVDRLSFCPEANLIFPFENSEPVPHYHSMAPLTQGLVCGSLSVVFLSLLLWRVNQDWKHRFHLSEDDR